MLKSLFKRKTRQIDQDITADSPIPHDADREPYKIDPAKDVASWIAEATLARDCMIDDMLGKRLSVRDGGMQGLVKQAYRIYSPRNWENPPFSREDGGDIDHMVFPYYFANVQNQIPVVIPGNVKMTALPTTGEKKQFAARATAILSEESEYLHFQHKLRSIVVGATNHGSQVAYYGASRSGMMQHKRVMEPCDPLAFLWDPGATSIEDSEYLIYLRWRLISEVKAEYDLDFEPSPEEMDPKHSSILTLNESINASSFGKNRCVEIIAFIRDTSTTSKKVMDEIEVPEDGILGLPLINEDGDPVMRTVEVPYQDPETGNEQSIEIPKYPNGRIVKFINGKKVFDENNPDEHGRCPFVKLDRHSYPGKFWGLPEWYTYGDIPLVINEAMSNIAKDMRTTVTKTIFKRSAFETPIDRQHITNSPDDFLVLKDGYQGSIETAVHRIKIGGANENAHAALTSVLQLGEDITGITDSFRGKADTNVTSGRQQQQLSEDSERRIFPFVKGVELFMEDSGYLMLHNSVQYRFGGDLIDIATLNDEDTSFSIEEFKKSFWKDVEFRIKIIANSGMPTDRQDRIKLITEHLDVALKYINLGAPEAARAFIKLSDLPELEEAFEMMMQKMKPVVPQQPGNIVDFQQGVDNDNKNSNNGRLRLPQAM